MRTTIPAAATAPSARTPPTGRLHEPTLLGIFLAFAFAYFLSALLRAVTATLAPVFGSELGLGAADLGLLAGAYFLGFALMQLPLGAALDRFGPRRSQLLLMGVAVLGCAGFALATSFEALIAGRLAIGIGVSACLMAPLTAYRRLLAPAEQLRANSWMLMTGSLGMVASTLPVQWLLPSLGWRGLFALCAAGLALAMVAVAWRVPGRTKGEGAPIVPRDVAGGVPEDDREGYLAIARHPLFVACAPMAVFLYGGMVAIQALWAGPWLTQVGGVDATAAAGGLLIVNVAMLLAFAAWGAVLPRLAARGVDAVWLMRRGLLLPFGVLAWILWLGSAATAWHWALWCVSCTFVTLSQPAVGAAFPAALTGRALSAFNLLIFVGVFAVQWGLGLAIDGLRALGADVLAAYRGAFAGFGIMAALSWLWFLWRCPSPLRPLPGGAAAPPGACP
jgi:MFS family permease